LFNQKWFEYTGLLYEQLEGAKWSAVIHPDDLAELGERWRHSLQTGGPYEAEARYRRSDGVYRWFLVRARAVFGDDRVVRWFGTSTDIHEQKRLEDDLRRANRDLESFAFTASHDLQEPLRTVALSGQLFRKRYGSQLDTMAIAYLDSMVEGAQRMSELIADLLAYTQAGILDAGTPPQVAAESVLAKVLVDLHAVMTKNQASVTYDPLPVVPVQEMHLHQLLQNLIANALKYRKESEDPRVHLSALRQDQKWLFSVKDNGIGIAPEYHNQVFGIFKRLHGKGSKYQGTGIGLAICQKTVERYDGQIWVESKLGEGSTFYFTVPTNEVHPAE
jgi:PAS domain S-box-containing protein